MRARPGVADPVETESHCNSLCEILRGSRATAPQLTLPRPRCRALANEGDDRVLIRRALAARLVRVLHLPRHERRVKEQRLPTRAGKGRSQPLRALCAHTKIP